LGSKSIKEKLTTIGFEINPLGPDKFGAYVEQQIKTWSELIKQTGIDPE
jgi:tripartite-type tricarboxylate transporter receptor subunit TctC